MVTSRQLNNPPSPSRWRVLTKGTIYEIEAVWCSMSVNSVLTFRDSNDNIVRAIKDWDDLWMVDTPFGQLKSIEGVID